MWKDKINTVWQGDCLDLMKEIPDESIDLILTDPPYNASNSNISFKNGGYKTLNADWDKNFKPREYIEESKRILKTGGGILIFCSQHLIAENLMELGKDWFMQLLVWHKSGMPSICKMYDFCTEYVIWGRKKGKQYVFNRQKNNKNIIKINTCSGVERAGHPTQKPLEIIKHFITIHSNKDDLIFDPFMGSWTTARACMDLGRNFIGAELSAEYCEIGRQRLRQQVLL